MSECCDNDSCSNTGYPKKGVCPVNGKPYGRVERKTLLHHLNKPWQKSIVEQAWYFCDSPDCDVIYFGQDNTTFTQADVRTPVGQKLHQPERTLCYCFDVQQQDCDSQLKQARQFVVEQTKSGSCDCEIRNPSGRCCLKDIPKLKP
ncbi:MAG: hypothetical protein OEY00_03915 [Gammaproteobacteria bacterium]|nr:hypothetical protein [Gammaproteobacteria bacterium]